MKEAVVDFPALSEGQNEKILKLLDNLQDCMETDMAIETMTIIRVKYDGTRADVGSILKRLAGDKTGLRAVTPRKYSSKIKPLRLADGPIDKSIDPLGS